MDLCYPDVLISITKEHLDAIDAHPMPSEDDLAFIVKLAFYASMEKEEGNPLRFSLVYLDRKSLGTKADYYWSVLKFEIPRPATVQEIAKLARATDSRCMHIVLTKGRGGFEIAGLARMGMDVYRSNRNETSGSKNDIVLWHARVKALGPGRITVGSHLADVVDFAAGMVLSEPLNVIKEGLVKRVLGGYGLRHFGDTAYWPYLRVVHNLLQHIVDLGHGGTLVIAPDVQCTSSMNTKYATKSDDLRIQFVEYCQAADAERESTGKMFDYSKRLKNGDPIDSEELATFMRLSSSRVWLKSTHETRLYDVLNSVAAFSLVDGALVIGSALEVLSIGAMFPWKAEGVRVVRSLDAEGSNVQPFDVTKVGSRHRSAAWFCQNEPGAIVFVVSTDGTVSCMSRPIGIDDVIVWQPVSLLWTDREMEQRMVVKRSEIQRRIIRQSTRLEG